MTKKLCHSCEDGRNITLRAAIEVDAKGLIKIRCQECYRLTLVGPQTDRLFNQAWREATW